jgi:hypothetical protein
MFHQLLLRLGLRRPRCTQMLLREITAIELKLAYRNQQLLRLYDEMEQLRQDRAEIQLKLDQWAERKPKSFRLATAAR